MNLRSVLPRVQHGFIVDFRASGCTSAFHTFDSTRLFPPSGSAFDLVPSGAASVCQAPGSTSVLQAWGSALGFRAIDVTLVHRPFSSAWVSISSSSFSVSRLPGSAQAVHQCSTLAPPSISSTMESLSVISSRVLSITVPHPPPKPLPGRVEHCYK